MNLRATMTFMLVAVLLSGCGSESSPGSEVRTTASPLTSDPEAADTASAAACSVTATPRPAVAGQLPAGFPTVTGWVATQVLSQGRTKAVRGLVPGEVKDLVAVRDAALERISTAGYRMTDSDEEPGYEAEAEFTGPYEGSINVRPGCRGYLLITYTINE